MTARIMSACLIKCSKSFNSAGTDNGEHKSTLKEFNKGSPKERKFATGEKGLQKLLGNGILQVRTGMSSLILLGTQLLRILIL